MTQLLQLILELMGLPLPSLETGLDNVRLHGQLVHCLALKKSYKSSIQMKMTITN